jgi:hypothetical protein
MNHLAIILIKENASGAKSVALLVQKMGTPGAGYIVVL